MRWKRSEKYYVWLESFLFTFIFSFFIANLFVYVAHYYNTLCEVKPYSSSLLKMTSHLSYKYHRMFKQTKHVTRTFHSCGPRYSSFTGNIDQSTLQFDCCKHIIQNGQNIRMQPYK